MKKMTLFLAFNGIFAMHGMHNPNTLFDAIRKGQKDNIKELIRSGHSPEDKDDMGRTSLQFAVWVHPQKREVITALLENGADVNGKDFSGLTPLHLVESEDLARLLLDHGAELLPDKAENTPVYYAASGGHTAVVRALLTHVTQADLSMVPTDVCKKDAVATIITRKLEAAQRILEMRNFVGDNVYDNAASCGKVSRLRECELSRLIDGTHLDGLRECIRQSANKAFKQRKLKQ